MNCGKRKSYSFIFVLPRANTTYLLQICIKGGRFSRTLNSHLLKFVQVGINNNVLVFMQLRHFFFVKMSFCLRPSFPLCLLYCNFKLGFYYAFVQSSNIFFCPFCTKHTYLSIFLIYYLRTYTFIFHQANFELINEYTICTLKKWEKLICSLYSQIERVNKYAKLLYFCSKIFNVVLKNLVWVFLFSNVNLQRYCYSRYLNCYQIILIKPIFFALC